MEVQAVDTFFESLKNVMWHESRLGKFVDFFRYSLPHFFKNIWHFSKAMWEFRDWDYRHNLKLLKTSLEITVKQIDGGWEEDVSRNKKVAQMKRAIELLNNFIEDNFKEQAEVELGIKVIYNDLIFEPLPDNPKLSRLVDDRTPEQQENNRKVYTRSWEMEELQWNELWDIVRGQKLGKDTGDTEFDGSGMRGWWD